MFHQKMRSVHGAGQQNLKRAHKASQRQNTSHSIVAGANRRQWGHILDDLQRRNMGKLHGSVRKGPPPHTATWKPEPRGYPSFDHSRYQNMFINWWRIPILDKPKECKIHLLTVQSYFIHSSAASPKLCFQPIPPWNLNEQEPTKTSKNSIIYWFNPNVY